MRQHIQEVAVTLVDASNILKHFYRFVVVVPCKNRPHFRQVGNLKRMLKLICVVGAGGDRPPDRRTQLGKISAQRADLTVLTSDNPRTEDPIKILATMEASFRAAGGKVLHVEPDRKKAIAFAVLGTSTWRSTLYSSDPRSKSL